MKKMKLFVWTGFSPDYTNGLAFAVAPDLETAMDMVIKERGFNVSEWGALEIHNCTDQIAFCVSGGG